VAQAARRLPRPVREPAARAAPGDRADRRPGARAAAVAHQAGPAARAWTRR
jgi:hypothetical protein